MDSKQAKRIVQNALGGPFDKANFVVLVKNILNHVQDAPFTYAGNLIFDDFKDSIQRVERVGKYQSPDDKKVDILVVHLKKETSLERARTKQRNFVAKYLKGSRGGELKDAALVAFVAPNGDWRFSFVKVEYTLTDGHKVTEEFTPARRYSFLVGPNENSHTAQSRLMPALLRENDPTLDYLEEIFSVEPVTDEFFQKYRDLFHRLVELLDDIVVNNEKVRDDFAVRDIEPADFAKKLLGQIVFLYFLQKKGWFGVPRGKEWGEGSKNFLRELFDDRERFYKQDSVDQDFFNGIMEPLFYEALRSERTDDVYINFNCKIPFLNGGLFDPLNGYSWAKINIPLPDDIFSNSDETGILDVFDRYNFTANEDEPLEKEVAVDPEMLGKVFENLLKVKDRKSKGTYYTPREIVHYMCREGLANYLATELERKVDKVDIKELLEYGEDVVENESHVVRKGKTKTYKPQLPESVCNKKNAKCIDDKLASIRVCDPAVGSGAFLVGMMNEIVRTRNALSPYINNGTERPHYHFKRQAIESCLYGVDIDSSATEIAKLRLWLSLVVDEEDRNLIKPLPNLDYKVVRGDSLLGTANFLYDSKKVAELKELQRRYIRETGIDAKRNLQRQIEALMYEVDTVQDSDFGAEFSFRRHFLEVFDDRDGFDVVIGNPPYGFRNVLTAEQKKYFRKEENIEFSSGDSAELFSKKSFDNLVAKGGVLVFIIPKKSLYGESWEGWRKDYLIKHNLLFLLDASKAFKEVLLEQAAFGLAKRNTQLFPVALARLTKKDTINKFDEQNKQDIYTKYNTFQIYRTLFDAQLLNKVKSQKYPSKLIKATLGLAIGQNFFSDEPTDHKLLKGIDIARWRVKGHRYLKNKQMIKNWDKARELLRPKVICQTLIAHIDNPYPHIKITASYDADGLVTTNTLTGFILEEPIKDKFWLAYLNSSFTNWHAYNFIYSRAIRTMHFYDFYVQQIPIPTELVEKPELQKPFIEIVDKILAITGTDDYLQNPTKQAQVREYEKQIDQLVYDLYDLTPGEIKTIEEGNNPK